MGSRRLRLVPVLRAVAAGGCWAWVRRSLFLLPLWPAVGTVGFGLTALQQGRSHWRSLRHDPSTWGFLLLSLAAVGSCLGASYPAEAWLGLANFLPFFGFFLALRPLLATPDRLQELAKLWVGSATIVAVLGLGQILAGWQTPSWWAAVLGWTLQPAGNPPGRLASTFLYANTCATFLGLAWVLGLGLAIAAWRNWRCDRARWQALAGLELALAAIGAALVLTSSRSAWIVALLAVLAYALYLGWYWLWGLAAIGCGSVLWAAFGTPPSQLWFQRVVPAYFWARLNDSLYPDRPAAILRTTQWQFCWDLTLARPWQGWGLRNFTPLYEAHTGAWLGHPHNLPLMLSAEWGIPATVLFLGLVGWPLVRAVGLVARSPRRDSSALAPPERLVILSYVLAFGACMLFNAADVTIFELRNNILGWLLLAALAGVTLPRQPEI